MQPCIWGEFFHPVDTSFTSDSLKLLGPIPVSPPTPDSTPHETSLQESFSNLHPSLRQICGNVSFPPDNGVATLTALTQSHAIHGDSDASLKDGKAAHAWVISPGLPEHLLDPTLNIHGSRPVDGYTPDMSSTRAEIHGIMAATIIAHLFLKYHSITKQNKLTGDSQSAIKKIPTHSSTAFMGTGKETPISY